MAMPGCVGSVLDAERVLGMSRAYFDIWNQYTEHFSLHTHTKKVFMQSQNGQLFNISHQLKDLKSSYKTHILLLFLFCVAMKNAFFSLSVMLVSPWSALALGIQTRKDQSNKQYVGLREHVLSNGCNCILGREKSSEFVHSTLSSI